MRVLDELHSLLNDVALLYLHCVSDVLDMRVLDGLRDIHDDLLHLHCVGDVLVVRVFDELHSLLNDLGLLHLHYVLDLLVLRVLDGLRDLHDDFVVLHLHCVGDVLGMRGVMVGILNVLLRLDFGPPHLLHVLGLLHCHCISITALDMRKLTRIDDIGV